MLDKAQGKENMQRNRHKHVGALLIEQIAEIIGPDYSVALKRERPWASITFAGTRHSITLSRSAQDETSLLLYFAKKLTRHEFDLPGFFVADVVIDDPGAQDDSVALEILTIDDPVARPAAKS